MNVISEAKIRVNTIITGTVITITIFILVTVIRVLCLAIGWGIGTTISNTSLH